MGSVEYKRCWIGHKKDDRMRKWETESEKYIRRNCRFHKDYTLLIVRHRATTCQLALYIRIIYINNIYNTPCTHCIILPHTDKRAQQWDFDFSFWGRNHISYNISFRGTNTVRRAHNGRGKYITIMCVPFISLLARGDLSRKVGGPSASRYPYLYNVCTVVWRFNGLPTMPSRRLASYACSVQQRRLYILLLYTTTRTPEPEQCEKNNNK